MASKPDYKNMKVGGEEYRQLVEDGKVKLMQEREQKRRAYWAARAAAPAVQPGTPQSETEGKPAASITAQHGPPSSVPIRDNRIERITAARDSTSLFLTPEPEPQAAAQQDSRDHEMTDAPSSPDEPLAARRRPSESSHRSGPGEGERVKSERSSESASSSSECLR